MSFEPLKEQIKKTITNLERGTPTYGDRIFLNHILEEMEGILHVDRLEQRQIDAADALYEMLGSTNELVEDGLED